MKRIVRERKRMLVVTLIVGIFLISPFQANAIILDTTDYKIPNDTVDNRDFTDWTGSVPDNWTPLQEPADGIDFTDECTSTYGWDRMYSWPYPDVYLQPDSISLISVAGYFYVPSIPGDPDHYNHGAMWVDSLGTTGRIDENLDFRAELQFVYQYRYMGDVFVTLFDSQGYPVFRIQLHDGWYSSTNDWYLKVLNYDGNTVSLAGVQGYHRYTGSTSGECRIWYEDGSIKGSLPGYSYTLCQPGEFDPSREVAYVGITFSNIWDYPYASKRILSISATSGLENEFHDSCDIPVLWKPESRWPGAGPSEVQTGIDLQTSNGHFIVPSIPDSEPSRHGPVFSRALDNPMLLSNDLSFEVMLKHVYEADTMGHLYVTVWDQKYRPLFQIYLRDAWYSSSYRIYLSFYYEDGTPGTKEVYGSDNFEGLCKIWNDAGTIRGYVGGSTYVLADMGSFNTDRLACHLTIAFANSEDDPYLTNQIDDIKLTAVRVEGANDYTIASSVVCYSPDFSANVDVNGNSLVLKQTIEIDTSDVISGHGFYFAFWFREESWNPSFSLARAAVEFSSDGVYTSVSGIWTEASDDTEKPWTAVSVDVPASLTSTLDPGTSFTVCIWLAGFDSGYYIDDAKFSIFDEIPAEGEHGSVLVRVDVAQHDYYTENERSMMFYVSLTGTATDVLHCVAEIRTYIGIHPDGYMTTDLELDHPVQTNNAEMNVNPFDTNNPWADFGLAIAGPLTTNALAAFGQATEKWVGGVAALGETVGGFVGGIVLDIGVDFLYSAWQTTMDGWDPDAGGGDHAAFSKWWYMGVPHYADHAEWATCVLRGRWIYENQLEPDWRNQYLSIYTEVDIARYFGDHWEVVETVDCTTAIYLDSP